MAQKLSETKEVSNGGGTNFFKVGPGQSQFVRWLYKTIPDIREDGRVAHSIKPEESGQKYPIEILCAAKSDETRFDDCIYCKANKGRVGRYPLALYNETTKQIEYWGRTGQWVDNTLIQILERVIKEGEPISGKIFEVARGGSGPKTTYSLIPSQAPNDGKLPEEFGEVLPPEERNCYRPENYEIPESTNGGANYINPNNQATPQYQQGYGQNYGSEMNMSGRRTPDMF